MPSRYGSSGFSGPKNACKDRHTQTDVVHWRRYLQAQVEHRSAQVPGRCCCETRLYRSRQCWWPQTQNRHWNGQISPSWSARTPAWLSLPSSWRLRTLRRSINKQNKINQVIFTGRRLVICEHMQSRGADRRWSPGICLGRSLISPWPSC